MRKDYQTYSDTDVYKCTCVYHSHLTHHGEDKYYADTNISSLTKQTFYMYMYLLSDIIITVYACVKHSLCMNVCMYVPCMFCYVNRSKY